MHEILLFRLQNQLINWTNEWTNEPMDERMKFNLTLRIIQKDETLADWDVIGSRKTHVEFDETSEDFIAETSVLDEGHSHFEGVRKHGLLVVRLQDGLLEDVQAPCFQSYTQGLKKGNDKVFSFRRGREIILSTSPKPDAAYLKAPVCIGHERSIYRTFGPQ